MPRRPTARKIGRPATCTVFSASAWEATIEQENLWRYGSRVVHMLWADDTIHPEPEFDLDRFVIVEDGVPGEHLWIAGEVVQARQEAEAVVELLKKLLASRESRET